MSIKKPCLYQGLEPFEFDGIGFAFGSPKIK